MPSGKPPSRAGALRVVYCIGTCLAIASAERLRPCTYKAGQAHLVLHVVRTDHGPIALSSATLWWTVYVILDVIEDLPTGANPKRGPTTVIQRVNSNASKTTYTVH